MGSFRRAAVALLIVATFATGCTPAASPTAAPTIVTFEVAGTERFRIELLKPEDLAHARQLLNGEAVSSIPLGKVVRDDPGINAPWSWHIDPATFEFAFAAIEVCDGLPSHVEDEVVTSDTYCPWSAKVVAVEPAQ